MLIWQEYGGDDSYRIGGTGMEATQGGAIFAVMSVRNRSGFGDANADGFRLIIGELDGEQIAAALPLGWYATHEQAAAVAQAIADALARDS